MFYDPAVALLGGSSSLDGTMQFYSRINALLGSNYLDRSTNDIPDIWGCAVLYDGGLFCRLRIKGNALG